MKSSVLLTICVGSLFVTSNLNNFSNTYRNAAPIASSRSRYQKLTTTSQSRAEMAADIADLKRELAELQGRPYQPSVHKAKSLSARTQERAKKQPAQKQHKRK